MAKTTITVEHKQNVWKKEGGSIEYACGLTFETNIDASAERELSMRIQQAFAFVRERVLRELEPKSPEFLSLLAYLDKADDLDKIEKLAAFIVKRINDGKLTEGREAVWLDELLNDKRTMLTTYFETQKTTPPAAASTAKGIVSDLKKQLALKTGNEIDEKGASK